MRRAVAEALWLGGAVVVAVVAGYLLRPRSQPAVPTPSGASTAPLAAPAVLTAEQVGPIPDGPCIGKYGQPPAGVAVFPDGTWLPPINGVTAAPKFPGFGGRPYAPVVSIYTHPTSGLQWYVHSDRTVSNTQMAEVKEGDRSWTEPIWVIGSIVPTQPLR